MSLAVSASFAIGFQPPAAQAQAVVAARAAPLEQITALRHAKRFDEALALCERRLVSIPGDTDAYRLRALLLADLGEGIRAWEQYRARPDLFDAGQRAYIEESRLVTLARHSLGLADGDPARRRDAEQADAAFATYFADLQAQGQPIPLRLRYDRLLLLNLLGRHAEVADEYAALTRESHAVPAYIWGTVADSLLARRRPHEAAKLLEPAVAAEPDNSRLHIQLAYAYLESERLEDALALMERFQAKYPVWLPGAADAAANWNRYDADTTLALLRAYTENLPAAQATFEQMIAQAPNDAGLQTSLGNVYQMRGWPERALERYRAAAALDANTLGAQIGQIEALTALRREAEARPLHDALLRERPGVARVQRMDRAWRRHQGWQGRVHGATGRSDGDVSPLGNRDAVYGIEIQSPLFDDHWRLTAVADERWADFHGERIHYRRLGAGFIYSSNRLIAGAGAHRAADGIGTGGEAFVGWRFNDDWDAQLTARANDPEASLQARASDIGADSVSLAVAYAPDERNAWRFGASRMRYEDGNTRSALSAWGSHRFVSRPRLLVDALAGAYASRGSHDDTPYFNPSRDASLELGLRADHLAWRRYSRHLRQRLTVSANNYWQEGYGSAWIPSLRYEHEWRLGEGGTLVYGLGWSRPVYDGQRERHLGFHAAYRWGD